MNYRIEGIDANAFSHLFNLTDDQLAGANAIRCIADAENAFPCRVSLLDAAIGESLLLINYQHQAANNAYQSRHAIYVNEKATTSAVFENEIPEQMKRRLLSIRAFDQADMMLDADVVDGVDAASTIQQFFNSAHATYLHIHYAKRGCFAARVDRN